MARKKETRHASGLVEYKATIGKTLDGKRIQKSFYGNSRLEAKNKADAYILQIKVAEQTNDIFIKKEYTFSEWALNWLKVYKKPLTTENGYKLTYENTVVKHLIPFFGVASLTSIRPADVQKFFATKTDYSKAMLSKMRMCLLGIFETAIDNDLCYKNPAKNATYTSNAIKNEKKVYTKEQIEKVEDAALGVINEVIILLETGLRRGELLGLKWEDIDFKSGMLSVRRSVADSSTQRIRINPPKWNSNRDIPLTELATKVLKMLIRNSEYIFVNENLQVQSPNSWSQKLRRFMNTLDDDTPRLTAHELRHTFGTNLRRNKVDIYTIQKVMGHKDIKMTSELYVHNENEELKRAMKI